jgi:hypothetical protein
VRACTALIWLRAEQIGYCEYGNELPGSINGGKFLAELASISLSRKHMLTGVSYFDDESYYYYYYYTLFLF